MKQSFHTAFRKIAAGLLLAEAVYFAWWDTALIGLYQTLHTSSMLSSICFYIFVCAGLILAAILFLSRRQIPVLSLYLFGAAAVVYGAWGVSATLPILTDVRGAFSGDAVAREFLSGIGFILLGIAFQAAALTSAPSRKEIR